ncbi:MAG: bacterial transcriptional activator domain-containing protein, partial [Clostridia bacterium]|nr:bacterial transcriptional activator domain-containing protein [Clostridia bacterium]
ELAETASSKRQALKFAKKAFELDPENIDAETSVAELTAKTSEDLIEKYKNNLDKATERITVQGYFDEENIGEFWLITETRPYMRLLEKYADILLRCGRIHYAITVCQEMLRLCENDNLGARYTLMHLYAYLEDEPSALELLKKYPNEKSSQILLPVSMLYYKLGDLKTATKYLKKLNAVNEDTYHFFDGIVNGKMEEYLAEMDPYSYRPFTIEELLVEAEENSFLMVSSSAYFEWGLRKLKGIKKK